MVLFSTNIQLLVCDLFTTLQVVCFKNRHVLCVLDFSLVKIFLMEQRLSNFVSKFKSRIGLKGSKLDQSKSDKIQNQDVGCFF